MTTYFLEKLSRNRRQKENPHGKKRKQILETDLRPPSVIGPYTLSSAQTLKVIFMKYSISRARLRK
jgi:hypothetical protein